MRDLLPIYLLTVITITPQPVVCSQPCGEYSICLDGSTCHYFNNGTQHCRCLRPSSETECDELDVRQVPPLISQQGPAQVVLALGEEFRMACEASGHPRPRYEWEKDGVEVGHASLRHLRLTVENGTLLLPSMTSSHEGFYQCLAYNDYGRQRSDFSHLRLAVLVSSGVSTTYDNQTVDAGDALVLSCPSIQSVPDARYEWLLADGRPLPSSNRTMIDDEGNLYFSAVSKEDEQGDATYRCLARNPFTKQALIRRETRLSVRQTSGEMVRPMELMMATASPHVSLLGSTLRLHCFFQGVPTPVVSWRWPNGSLPEQRARYESFNRQLVIEDVQKQDEGIYVCTASNGLGQPLHHAIHLRVQAKPRFLPEGLPRNINASEGETVTFDCVTEGLPEARVEWFINGVAVSGGELGSRRSISEDGRHLSIEKVCKQCPSGFSDQMTVQCNASNTHGYVLASAYLNVYLRTVIVNPPVSQTYNPFYNLVKFDCGVSADPGRPYETSWWFDHVRLPAQHPVPESIIVLGKDRLVLRVQPQAHSHTQAYEFAGNYTCEVTNGLSSATATAQLRVPHLASSKGSVLPTCDEQCSDDGCWGGGQHQCGSCRNYQYAGVCLASCSDGLPATTGQVVRLYESGNWTCAACHARCTTSCTGPGLHDCLLASTHLHWTVTVPCHADLAECKKGAENALKCYEDINEEEKPASCVELTSAFACAYGSLHNCTLEDLGVVTVGDTDDTWDTVLFDGLHHLYQAFIVVIGLIVTAIVLLVAVYFRCPHLLLVYRTKQLQDHGCEDDHEQEMWRCGAADMASLRVITDCELHTDHTIGSGAFGVVLSGLWMPENEEVKIPVAIKVLRECSSSRHNQELLAEARIMATVQHPYCVRLLAICMSSPMKLVTQLLPLGCLLAYIRKHKENIGSKALLTWSTQIAKGMCYLESRDIVHRDLAARNVLVKSPYHVKITDFGLSKILEDNQGEITTVADRVPVKWLAIECLEEYVYSSKSDVWSFGVTLWELFTYGERPYDDVNIYHMLAHIRAGKRLSQPAICSIDIYMLLLKCWLLEPSSRISFQELSEEFDRMLQDSGRYLVIQGDYKRRLPSYGSDTEEYIRAMGMRIHEEYEGRRLVAEDYLEPRPSNNNDVITASRTHSGRAKQRRRRPRDELTNWTNSTVPSISQNKHDHLKSTPSSTNGRVHSNHKSPPPKNDHIQRVDEEGYLLPKTDEASFPEENRRDSPDGDEVFEPPQSYCNVPPHDMPLLAGQLMGGGGGLQCISYVDGPPTQQPFNSDGESSTADSATPFLELHPASMISSSSPRRTGRPDTSAMSSSYI